MALANVTQFVFRFYVDDTANADTNTALAAQNASISRGTGTANRVIVRVGMQNDSAALWNTSAWWEYDKNGASAWAILSLTSTGARIVDCLPTDGSLCSTERLTGGTGTWEDDGEFHDATALITTVHIGKTNHQEQALGVYIVDADVSNGDYFRFRIEGPAVTAWTSIPRWNVVKAAPITGTGTMQMTQPVLAATGKTGPKGSGIVAMTALVLAALGSVVGPPVSGTGTMALAPPTLAATGTQAQSGTGTMPVTPLAFTGAGVVITPVTGTGTLAVAPPTITGTGTQTQSGSGVLAAPVPAFDATGTVANIVGDGTLAVTAVLDATGTVAAPITGSGTVALAPPTHPWNPQGRVDPIFIRYQTAGVPSTGTSGGSNQSVALPQDLVSNHLVVLSITWDNSASTLNAVSAVTDSQGNAYTLVEHCWTTQSQQSIAVYYGIVENAGPATITVSYASTNVTYRGVFAIVYEGGDETVAVHEAIRANNQSGIPDPGTLTPNRNGQLLFATALEWLGGSSNLDNKPAAPFSEQWGNRANGAIELWDVIDDVQGQLQKATRTTFWTVSRGVSNCCMAVSFYPPSWSGSGSLAVVAAMSGDGTVSAPGVSGSGSMAVAVPVLAADGTQEYSATGTLAAPVPALAATGTTLTPITGTGTLALTASMSGSGTAATGFLAQRQAIIDGLLSDGSEPNGWNAVVRAGLSVDAVVRTSDTVVTITLPPFASYDIAAIETVTATVPGAALASGVELAANETLELQPDTLAVTGTGSMAVTPAMAGVAIAGNIGSGALALDVSMSGTGSQAQSGSGALVVPTPTHAGAGAQGYSGTGSLAVGTPTLQATGTQTHAGAGALALTQPAHAGAGTVTAPAITGTGSLAVTATITGTGTQAQSGTGALALTASLAALGGTGQFAYGEMPATIPVLAATGTHTQNVTATGALAITQPVLTGTAIRGNTATGTLAVVVSISGQGSQEQRASGVMAVPSPSFSGTGALILVGTGVLTAPQPSISGAGVYAITANGILPLIATITGTGTHQQNAVGSGVLTVPIGIYSVGNRQTIITLSGKYRPEHAGALTDVGAARGFAGEHAGALTDVGAVSGFANEHASALTDVGEAGTG